MVYNIWYWTIIIFLKFEGSRPSWTFESEKELKYIFLLSKFYNYILLSSVGLEKPLANLFSFTGFSNVVSWSFKNNGAGKNQ